MFPAVNLSIEFSISMQAQEFFTIPISYSQVVESRHNLESRPENYKYWGYYKTGGLK